MTAHICDQPTGFWAIEGDRILPINAALYMRIANTENVAVTISELHVDAQGTDGAWVNLQHVRSQFGGICYASDFKQAKLLAAETPRLDVELGRGVEPRGEARGWMFLRYPHGFERHSDLTLRVTVVDATGRRYEIPPLGVVKSPVQELQQPFLAIGNFVDISGFKVGPCWTP